MPAPSIRIQASMKYAMAGEPARLEFDYIIVGGGTSGCVVANKLVLAGFTVLVVERGPGAEIDEPNNIPGNFLKMLDTEANWQYDTVPQKGLHNRVLKGHRGTGLGGSSRLNFMSWVRGPKVDYDDWASLVGDDSWKWDNILPDLKSLETLDEHVANELKSYVRYTKEHHGYTGPIDIGTGTEALPGTVDFINACIEAGIPLNPDHNSGDPIGVSVAQLNCPRGIRIHSASAFLSHSFQHQFRSRLKVYTKTVCYRIMFESKKAVGVEISDRKAPLGRTKVYARSEVIVTSGTFGTPHLLLLSGIGDEQHLRSVGVPLVAHIPGVGQGLQDHAIYSCEYLQDPSIASYNHFLQDPELQSAATAEYLKSQKGPLVKYGGAAAVSFPVIEALFSSPEFQSLSPAQQRYLKAPTRPTVEYWLMSGPLYYKGNDLEKTDSVVAHEILLQNCLSTGSVKLASSDPTVPPLIDPNYLQHPYDVRMAVEALRTLLKIAKTTIYKPILRGTLVGPWPELGYMQELDPDTLSESVLENFARATIGQGLHAVSTCKMTQAQDPMGVVDSGFRVRGVKGLRIADISVCPILTSNHTQVNAYLTGLKCAKMILSDRIHARL